MPWTENSLSQLIEDVDKDKDGKLTFREVRFIQKLIVITVPKLFL